MTDKTYCAYAGCPLKNCDRHLSQLKSKSKDEYISVCDFAPICRKYLAYVLKECENNDR